MLNIRKKKDQVAFPHTHSGEGLNKLEYFTAIALQGMLANQSYNGLTPETIAKSAINYAKATIDALDKEP